MRLYESHIWVNAPEKSTLARPTNESIQIPSMIGKFYFAMLYQCLDKIVGLARRTRRFGYQRPVDSYRAQVAKCLVASCW